MDYKVLEIARTYSVDAETLVKNYNRIIDGLKSHEISADEIKNENIYTESDLFSFGRYLFSIERRRSIDNGEDITIVSDSDVLAWKKLNDK